MTHASRVVGRRTDSNGMGAVRNMATGANFGVVLGLGPWPGQRNNRLRSIVGPRVTEMSGA